MNRLGKNKYIFTDFGACWFKIVFLQPDLPVSYESLPSSLSSVEF